MGLVAKSLGNCAVTYNSNAMAAKSNATTLDASTDALDDTNYSSAAAALIPGSTDWTLEQGGNWDAALDGYIGPDALTPPATMRTLTAVFGAAGDQTTFTWTANAFISGYKIEAAPNSLITYTVNYGLNGAPVRS